MQSIPHSSFQNSDHTGTEQNICDPRPRRALFGFGVSDALFAEKLCFSENRHFNARLCRRVGGGASTNFEGALSGKVKLCRK
jgi:hypothetical protein